MPTIAAAIKGGTLTQKQVIDLLYSQSMKKLRAIENGNTSALMDAYKRAQDELIARIANSFGSVENWNLQDWEKSGRLRDLLSQVDNIVARLQQTANYEIEKGSTIQFMSAYDRSIYTMDQATPADTAVKYAPPPEDAVKILANTPYKGAMFSQRIGLITDAMASGIKTQLTQSMIQGESMSQAAKRISSIIGAGNGMDAKAFSNRALTIARSEIMRAQNMAHDFAYEQNSDLLQGDGETEWLVTPDDKLCRWCARRDGMTDAEIADADSGKDPWGNSTDCPLHPNCRCVKMPKLKSWSGLLGIDMPETMQNDVRGMRNDDGDWSIQPVQTFDSWLAGRNGYGG
jgi:hypothetical protein